MDIEQKTNFLGQKDPSPLSNNKVIGELKHRVLHHSPSVRDISQALLYHAETFPNGWVNQAITSTDIEVHHSSLQQALSLEKIALKGLLGEFWEKAVLCESREDFTALITKTRDAINKMNPEEWKNIVSQINPQEAEKLLGLPIQTNRLGRYESLLTHVLAPLFPPNSPEINIIDAGGAAGFGAVTAESSPLPINNWIVADLRHPEENLPWKLTCSVRIEEISDPTQEEQLWKMTHPQKHSFALASDMRDLPLADNSGPQVYLAVFSYYQLTPEMQQQALSEAKRIVPENGLILITDHSQYTLNNNPIMVSSSEGQLQTLAWIKKKGQLVGPIIAFNWKDSELKDGTPIDMEKIQNILIA